MGQKHETAVGSRGSAATGLTIEELAGIRFFAGVPGWALERLAGSAAKRRLEQGALVIQQNNEARGDNTPA